MHLYDAGVGESTKRRLVIGAIALVIAGGLFVVLRKPGAAGHAQAEFVRLMNLGKGRVENRESAQAVKVLTEAVKLSPDSAPALRNLARAYLIAKDAPAAQSGVEVLTRAVKIDPDSPATQYLMGLALNRTEHYDQAVAFLERAVQLDPKTPALRYQLGRAYEHVEKHDRAKQQFEEAIRLDPLNTAAYYRLAAHARQERNRDEVIRLTSEFQRLKDLFPLQPEDVLEKCVHTAPESGGASRATASAGASPAISVRWNDMTVQTFRSGDNVASTAAVIETDRTGHPTVFAAGPAGELSLLTMTQDGTFSRRVVTAGEPGSAKFTSCAVGDFFMRITRSNKTTPKHDARNDILLIGPAGAKLLERTGDDSFVDQTAAAGLTTLTGRRARWCDYDHNGVLDLLVAGDAGLQLWQNNSYVIRIDTTGGADADPAGTPLRFDNVTETVGITPTGPARDVTAVDLDDNVAVDLIAGCGAEPTRVFMNQRAGRFAPMVEPPGPWPPALSVLTDDLDNDGVADVVLLDNDHAVVMLEAGAQRRQVDLAGLASHGALLIDFDNDGLLDLVAYGHRKDDTDRGMVRVLRNVGNADGSDATESTGIASLAMPPVRDAFAADFDADGDTDLMLVGEDDRLRLLRNDGGNAHRQLKLRLVTILTNPTGLGDRIELRDGDRWVSRIVTGVPVEIGVGASTQLDTVHVLWTNGVVDNEFLVSPSATPVEIVEKMVELGSCPFLFAWNGERSRFVTDILGNAPIGLSLRRGEFLPADPDEIVYIADADELPPRDGFHELEVAECYREVLYLDAADLIAVDHPPDIEVHPTDKLMPPPFPASEVLAIADALPPIRVESDDAVERTAALAAIDGEYAPPGETLPPPFRGLCHPLTLTLDFGPIDARQPLVLALTGWLRYGSASVNIAVAQNPGLTLIPPTLEVETQPDVWQVVDVVVGMPAGKTKTILVDLSGKLPASAGRLRLTSTFEIRWDRIALARQVDLPENNVHVVAPASADLHWRGFPEMRPLAPNHAITPNEDRIAAHPPWRTMPQGWCTRYGDVQELVAARDGMYIIINGGDGVTLRYPAADLPAIPPGMTRSHFFRSVGWEKDADYNVVTGDTVNPLPSTSSQAEAPQDWQLKYNTRWVPSHPFTDSGESR